MHHPGTRADDHEQFGNGTIDPLLPHRTGETLLGKGRRRLRRGRTAPRIRRPGRGPARRGLNRSGRSASENYLETLANAFFEPDDDVPPLPDLQRLRDEGLPTVPDDDFADALADLLERRRNPLGIVRADAWYWPPLQD